MKNTLQQQPKQNLRLPAQALPLLKSVITKVQSLMSASSDQTNPVCAKSFFVADTCLSLGHEGRNFEATNAYRGHSISWNQICSIRGVRPTIAGVR